MARFAKCTGRRALSRQAGAPPEPHLIEHVSVDKITIGIFCVPFLGQRALRSGVSLETADRP